VLRCGPDVTDPAWYEMAVVTIHTSVIPTKSTRHGRQESLFFFFLHANVLTYDKHSITTT
jgi:hypothetical protein